MQKIIKHGHFPSTVPREVCCSGLHTWSTPVYCDLVKNKESDTFTTSLYTQHSHLRGLVLQPNAGFRWNLNSASMYFLTYFPHLWPGTKKAEGWFSSFPALLMFSCMTDVTWLHLSIRPQRENRHASLNDIKTWCCCCSVSKSCHVWLFVIPWAAACQASLSFTISQSLLWFMSLELVMPSNHLILCRPLLLSLSSVPASGSFPMSQALCIRWPKYWSFSFSISPSNEYSGLISLTIDWFDFLAVQGTLKSLLQDHNSKASLIQCSIFFMG